MIDLWAWCAVCVVWVGTVGRNLYWRGMKAVVSEKGQVTIPKQLRERLGLRPGMVLEFRDEGGALVGTKLVERDPVDAVYGILPEGFDTDAYLAAARGDVDTA